MMITMEKHLITVMTILTLLVVSIQIGQDPQAQVKLIEVKLIEAGLGTKIVAKIMEIECGEVKILVGVEVKCTLNQVNLTLVGPLFHTICVGIRDHVVTGVQVITNIAKMQLRTRKRHKVLVSLVVSKAIPIFSVQTTPN